MLITPWLLGAVLRARAGEPAWFAEVALLAFWIAAYLVFQALSVWLKAAPVKRPSYVTPVVTYATVAGALGGVALLALGLEALWWAPAFVPLLTVALVLAWQRRERALLGGVVTVGAACLLGLVARHPTPRVPDAVTAVAIGAAFAYFVGTVVYVKTMIRERGKRGWVVGSVAYHALAALIALAGWVAGVPTSLPWLALLFAAATVRAVVLPRVAQRRTITPLVVGLIEIAFTLGLVVACLVPAA